jgi:pyruvate dehydrogenase E2 component (dihydrolipoamide acetyltransferase)
MSTPILMPALSPTMEEGKLAKWHVKVGDKVKSGDVIAEIETDKATMEVEAVDEGVVAELLVAEGSEGVKVNAVIAQLAEEGEKYTPAEKPAAATAPKPAPTAPSTAAAQRWRGPLARASVRSLPSLPACISRPLRRVGR